MDNKEGQQQETTEPGVYEDQLQQASVNSFSSPSKKTQNRKSSNSVIVTTNAVKKIVEMKKGSSRQLLDAGPEIIVSKTTENEETKQDE